jgi:hypothetical protein
MGHKQSLTHLRVLMDERDVRYGQRFEAQQKALDAALASQKEATANALAAADRAVTKAEDASNKRFDSVNEFRQTLTDQANSFVSKDAYKAMEDKVSALTSRLDNIRSSAEGAGKLWAMIVGVVFLVLAVAAFAANRLSA